MWPWNVTIAGTGHQTEKPRGFDALHWGILVLMILAAVACLLG